jgi:hypothetical protein
LPNVIQESYATGEEIHALCTRIEDSVTGAPLPHIIIACLSLAIVMMNPTITAEKLSDTVSDVSKYICLTLDSSVSTGNEPLAN